MARPTAEEARQRLIEAGRTEFLALLKTGVVSSPVDHLDLKAIAKRAGYRGPGMIYNSFPAADDQSARDPFVDALTERIVDIASSDTRAAAQLGRVIEEGMPLDEIIQSGARFTWDQAQSGDSVAAYLALAALPTTNEQRKRFSEIETQRTIEMGVAYEAALAAHGRKLKPGITNTTLALILRALETGLYQIFDVSPELDPGEMDWAGSEGWNLLGIAAREIAIGLSVPIDEIDTTE